MPHKTTQTLSKGNKNLISQRVLTWLDIKTFFEEITSSGKYFTPLTGLRGLAATLVLLFHVSMLIPIYDDAGFLFEYFLRYLYGFGFLGVNLFFVLSGFLLSFSFLSAYQKSQRPNLRKFALNRCLRVLPSYYFQILIIVVCGKLFLDQHYSAYDIMMHLLMLHNVDVSVNHSINGVYWTLPIEWNFYYVLPLLALLLRKKRWIWLIIIAAVVGLCSRIVVGEHILQHADVNVRVWLLSQLFCIPEYFLFGMVAAYWRFKLMDDAWAIRYGDVVMVVSLFLFCFSLFQIHWFEYWVSTQHYWWNSFAPILMTTFVFGVSAQQKLARLMWANRAMMVLGILSYSIYLWHLIVIDVLKQWGVITWFKNLTAMPLTTSLYLLTVVIISITLVISYLNYRFIEKPFIQRKYRQ